MILYQFIARICPYPQDEGRGKLTRANDGVDIFSNLSGTGLNLGKTKLLKDGSKTYFVAVLK